jgi:hypothetical protein
LLYSSAEFAASSENAAALRLNNALPSIKLAVSIACSITEIVQPQDELDTHAHSQRRWHFHEAAAGT